MNRNTAKLKNRDFIFVGTSSLIYAVVAFIIGGVTQMTPLTSPYLAVTRIIIRLLSQNYELPSIGLLALIALSGYFGSTWMNTASTMLSHHSAFTILKNIRTELTAKLSRVPMGYILDTPPGKFNQCGTYRELMNGQGLYRRFIEAREAATGWSIGGIKNDAASG